VYKGWKSKGNIETQQKELSQFIENAKKELNDEKKQ
jgi:hypothetical protein